MAVYTHTTESQSIFNIQTPTFAFESGSFSYNQNSELYLIVKDFGDILDGINEEIDAGDVLEPIAYFEDYGDILFEPEQVFGEIDTLETNTLIGFGLGHIGGGVAFALQGGVYASFGNAYIGYECVTFTKDNATIISNTFTHSGSGNLSGIIGAAERVTSSFNISSVALFALEDFRRPFGRFRFTGIVGEVSVPFIPPGSGSLFSFVNGDESTTPATHIGQGNLFTFAGSSTQLFNPAPYTGTGSLFNFVSKEERVTSSYNNSSVTLFSSEDNNLISENYNKEEDYNYINSKFDTTEDYGSILILSQGNPFGLFRISGDGSKFTRFSLTTNDPVSTAIRYSGHGSESITPYIPPGFGKFEVSGGISKESFIPPPYIGSGTISSFVTKEERATFHYNQSSRNFLTDDDFGFINESSPEISLYADTEISELADEIVSSFTTSGFIDPYDFGSISEIVNSPGSEDFGSISNSDEVPFGAFKFVGDASKTVTFILTANPEGGSLFGFGGGTEAVTPFIPEKRGLFKVVGSAAESITPKGEVGSGTLFNFVTKEERRTFSYNGSSIIDQDNIDFGVIATTSIVEGDDGAEEVIELVPHDDQDDFGIISELVNRPDSEDFGFITTKQGRPYGSLRFTGDASNSVKFRVIHIGSGSLFAIGGSGISVSLNEPTDGLFTVLGNNAKTTRFSLRHIGSGTLFNFVTKEERRTFSYNGSSVTGYNVSDYGFVASTVITSLDGEDVEVLQPTIENPALSEDYGSVTDFPDTGNIETILYPNEDYGLITVPVDEQRRPFGRFKLLGIAGEVRIPPPYIGSGSLFAIGGSGESITPVIPEGEVLFSISGSATESITPAVEVGSGSLFNFVTKEERRTFSYNGSSVVSQEDDDFGVIATTSIVEEEEVIELVPHDDQDDFGIISELVNRPDSEDFGFITTGQGRPYGSLRFTGDASKGVKFQLRASGGGSLFALGGGNESITPFIPASFILFTVVGSATERITPGPHIGSGTLFNFVTKEERRTFSYNGSSLATLFASSDYGLISDSSPTISSYADIEISEIADEIVSSFTTSGVIDSEDYGYINEVINAPGSDDYGLVDFDTNRPFGRFRLFGIAPQAFIPRYIGSGSLSPFGGSGETVSLTDDTKVLFTVSGAATQNSTPAPHIGSGTLFNFVNADESKTFRHISDKSTGLKISGEVSDIKLTNDEVGIGRLFAASGAAETFGANPFIPPALFRFKSSSAESFTPATEIGTGIISPRRSSAIFDPEQKIRLAAAAESTTTRLVIAASGFSINASPSRVFFQPSEVGSGRLTLSGNAFIRTNPRHFGDGRINVNGIGNEAIVPFIPPGSGSLFSFVNGDESTTPATHIGQGNLFRPRGAAETQFPRGYLGTGEITVNVETGIIVIWDYPVNLTIPVRGDTDYAVVRDYVGSGKFNIVDESQNYFANRFFSFSGGFSILGKAGISVPRVYSGSGVLFGFDSSAENTGANPPDRTLPIRIIGNANESKTEIFNGSGFITSSEKRAERVLRYTSLSSPKISQYADTPISDLSNEVVSELLQEGLLEEYSLISATESFVSAPPSKDSAITIEGSRNNENATSDYVGSGSLFAFDSSTESTLYSPIGEITLFEFEGNLEESRAFSYSEKTQGLFGKDSTLPKPFGQQFVFGSAIVVSTSAEESKDKAFKFDGGISTEIFAPANEASGGLFGFNSSTESVLYSPIGEITLFEFEGNSEESITAVSIGTGSLFGFVSSSESSLVEPPVETLLLTISGSATERITPAPHSGSGTVFAFVGSAESKTSVEEKKVLFRFNIEGVERSVSVFEGTGTITSFVGSANAVTFDYPLTQKILKIFGTKFESFARANYDGECATEFVGASSDKVVEFESPKPTRLYII